MRFTAKVAALTLTATAGGLLFAASPAAAYTPVVYGKPASHAAQVAACKTTGGHLRTLCRTLAAEPAYRCDINNNDVVSVVPNGARLVWAIRNAEPRRYWAGSITADLATFEGCKTGHTW